MRILLTIKYDGTDFCGWQVQPNKRTVQGVITEAIYLATKENVTLVGSGRTDSGVHANGQTATFDTLSNIPPESFYKAINVYLPNDVVITSSKQVADDFSARFSAKRKTYSYTFYIADYVDPLKSRYATRLYKMPDINLIKNAGEKLIGTHNFKCFLASNSSVKDTIRTIYSFSVESDSEYLKLTVEGNGFLYNMVRIIAGTMVEIGYKEKTVENLVEGLNSGDRKKVGKTMAPNGLVLENVKYF